MCIRDSAGTDRAGLRRHQEDDPACRGHRGLPGPWRRLQAVSYTHLDVYKRQGIEGLRDRRIYALPGVEFGGAFSGFSDIKPVKSKKKVIGRSELLGGRK